MNTIPTWITKTTFQCDVTKESYEMKDLYVAWYDKYDEEKSTEMYKMFMLVKQGEGFGLLKNHVDDWSLSHRPLQKVMEENVVLFFTDFMSVDTIHDNGKFKKEVVDAKSWSTLFRRLTIPGYEVARHHLKDAKKMGEFHEYTEFQILQPDVLSNFLRELGLHVS